MSVSVDVICTDALREIGVLNAVDVAGGEDSALALSRLNLLLDSMQAEPLNTYAPAIAGLSLPLASGDLMVLPPGYQQFLTMALAIDLGSPFRVAVGRDTIDKADEARSRINAVTAPIPRLRTLDAGIPGSCTSSGFDYRRGY
jgi:hypothetical protein